MKPHCHWLDVQLEVVCIESVHRKLCTGSSQKESHCQQKESRVAMYFESSIVPVDLWAFACVSEWICWQNDRQRMQAFRRILYICYWNLCLLVLILTPPVFAVLQLTQSHVSAKRRWQPWLVFIIFHIIFAQFCWVKDTNNDYLPLLEPNRLFLRDHLLWR